MIISDNSDWNIDVIITKNCIPTVYFIHRVIHYGLFIVYLTLTGHEQLGAKCVETTDLTEGELCHEVQNALSDFLSLNLPSNVGQTDKFDMSGTHP